ncbi:MAG: hypothetical protein ACRERU_05905 [Methylococcales bacterium]
MKAKLLRQTLTGLAGCLLILSNSRSDADTVQLTNGDRISGKLQSLTGLECILNTDFQAGLRIPLKRISVLQTDHAVAVNLKSGERIDGLVNIQFKQGSLRVRSERFGSVALTIDELIGISTRSRPEVAVQETDEAILASLQGKGGEGQSSPANSSTPAKVGAEQAKQQEDEQVQQIFLRASGVLLEPGDGQIEASLNYAREEQAVFLQVPSTDSLALFESRVRTFLMPVIGRLGLLPGLEGFLNVPIQFQERQRIGGLNGFLTTDESSLFSLGDVQAGLKYALHREDSLPEIIGTLDLRAPTGRVRSPLLATAPLTGSGQWAAAGGVNLIKSFDPLILFGGIRYEYDIFNDLHDIKFGPWSSLSYNGGFGFAVNHRVTLVGQFLGIYQSKRSFSGMLDIGGGQVINGAVVPDRELATLRGAFTYKIAGKQYIEPSITFGLNDVSPDLIIGLSYTQGL